jgi:hypothetical protein
MGGRLSIAAENEIPRSVRDDTRRGVWKAEPLDAGLIPWQATFRQFPPYRNRKPLALRKHRARGWGESLYPARPFAPAPACSAEAAASDGVTTTEPVTLCGLTRRLVMGHTFSEASTRRSMRSWLSGEVIWTS